MNLIEAGQILETGAWMGTLSPAIREALLAAGRIRTVDNCAAVYRAGDPGDGLYAMLDGEVRLIGYSGAGRRIVYLILRPADWFGEISVLDGRPRLHDAIAFGTCTILHVDMVQIDAIALDHPRFDRAIGALTCSHQRTALAFVEQALTSSSETRLAFVLMEMAGRWGMATERGVEIDLRLSQEDLAAMVGLSRQSVASLLGRLRREGVIDTRYRCLTILDLDRLKLRCGR